MPIASITNGEGGASVRAKLNDVITEANAVAGKVSLSGAETVAGVKTFTSTPVISGVVPSVGFDETDQAGGAGKFRFRGTQAAFQLQRNTAADGSYSTVAVPVSFGPDDIATFLQSPVIPAPTIDTNPATKGYVDDELQSLGLVNGDFSIGPFEGADYGLPGAVFGIVHEDHALLLFDPVTGRALTVLDPEHTAESLRQADFGADTVIALGARGTPRNVHRLGYSFYTYETEINGAYKYVMVRADRANRAHLLHSSDNIHVHESIGQSWEGNNFPNLRSWIGDPECESVVTLHITNAANEYFTGPALTATGVSLGGTPDDLAPFDDDDHISIGRCLVIAYQRLSRLHGKREEPILQITAAYPSSDYETGGGGGIGPGGTTWTNKLTLEAAINTLAPSLYDKEPLYRSINYTQGGALDNNYANSLAWLGDLVDDNDALALPGTDDVPLKFYINHPSPREDHTFVQEGRRAHLDYCRSDTTGRVKAGPAWYHHRYYDELHVDAYGSIKTGEVGGYAKFVEEQLGMSWNPLWRSELGMTYAGNVITVPFKVPRVPDFSQAQMEFSASYDLDGVEMVPLITDRGFVVRRGGIAQTISSIALAPRWVEAASTAALPAFTHSGGVLTADANGAFPTQDGITLTLGQDYLYKNDTNRIHNGIYQVIQVGDAGEPWKLIRTDDADTWATIIYSVVTVRSGTANAGSEWAVMDGTKRFGVLGVNAVTWSQIYRGLKRSVEITMAGAPASGDEVSYAWYGPGATKRSGVWGNLKVNGPEGVLIKGDPMDIWALPMPPEALL